MKAPDAAFRGPDLLSPSEGGELSVCYPSDEAEKTKQGPVYCRVHLNLTEPD